MTAGDKPRWVMVCRPRQAGMGSSRAQGVARPPKALGTSPDVGTRTFCRKIKCWPLNAKIGNNRT